MSTCEWEERVALLVDGIGDAAVERHAAECVQCGELLAAMRQQQTALRVAPEISEYALSAVRARVMADIEAPRRWRWAWAAAVPVLAGAAMVAVWMRPAERTPVEAPRSPVIEAKVEPPAPAPVQKVVRRKPRREKKQEGLSPEMERRLAELMAPKREPMVPRNAVYVAQTKDPDVMIVLIPPTKGEPND